MGGNVWVNSEPGKGSQFFFQIPFAPIREGVHRHGQNSLSGSDWKNKNIVLVEDDEDNIKYIELILRKTGANIILTPNSTSFRKLLTPTPDIHLVLMDIQLPGEDGWKLTRFIKSLHREIPVVIQTAYGSDADRIKSLEAGCDHYLAKPISPDELLKIIAIHLDK
jgi:CheY-like chemotaxis protein